MAKSVKNIESDKQHFRLCVHPCPCFITGGDTHGLYVAYLGPEHAWSALEGADQLSALRSPLDADAPLPESTL